MTEYQLERICAAIQSVGEAQPTLRDRLAIALIPVTYTRSMGEKTAAEQAYHMADLMLAARDKPTSAP